MELKQYLNLKMQQQLVMTPQLQQAAGDDTPAAAGHQIAPALEA